MVPAVKLGIYLVYYIGQKETGTNAPNNSYHKEVAMKECKNILFCTDFSEDANHAFLHALDLAEKNDARLHILHMPHSPYVYCKHIVDEHVPEGATCGESFFNAELVETAEEALRREYADKLNGYKNYTLAVRDGLPYVEIVRYAKKNDIDQIVMGDRGKYELDRIERGSTVDKVVRYSRFPVTSVNGRPIPHYR